MNIVVRTMISRLGPCHVVPSLSLLLYFFPLTAAGVICQSCDPKDNYGHNYRYPLQVACEKEHFDVVRLLLHAEGIDVNKEVSIMMSLSTMLSLSLTYRRGMFFLFPPTESAVLCFVGWVYRDSEDVGTGRWN